MSNPPVCHIPPVQPTTQPKPVNLPSIPPVTNPTPSNLQNSINLMRQVINYITGNQPPTGQNQTQAKPARWSEFSRQVESVTITDPNSGASVTFDRINQLVMHDQVTGESWSWNREPRQS